MTKKTFAEFFARLGAPSRTVGSAAFLIAVAGVASRILGFFRDRILASQFGAGDTLDVYYAAFRIPDMLYGLLVAGALSAAFIPVFTELIAKKDEARAWRLADGVLHLLTASLGILAFVGIIFASELMSLIAPGFSPEKREAAASLTRIMLLSPIFLSVSAVFGGILVSFKRFAAYSFAPIFYNAGIITGAVLLVPVFGIAGLGWGVVLGSFARIRYLPDPRHFKLFMGAVLLLIGSRLALKVLGPPTANAHCAKSRRSATPRCSKSRRR